MTKIVGTAIVIVVGLLIATPLIVRLVNVLFIPIVVGVALYLVVRIVNAYLNRW
jgi:hypothetical protein